MFKKKKQKKNACTSHLESDSVKLLNQIIIKKDKNKVKNIIKIILFRRSSTFYFQNNIIFNNNIYIHR